MDYPIEELELSVRAYNILKRMGINTTDQLLAHTRTELKAFTPPAPNKPLRDKELDWIDAHLIHAQLPYLTA